MKKLMLAAAAMLLALNANAQLGITGGLTSNTTTATEAYQDMMSQSVNTYHAGIVYKLNLPMGLFVQPGVLYNIKGQALSTQLSNQEFDVDMTTGYVEVPVRLGYGYSLGVVTPFVFVEPYAGYAITTESKAEFKDATSQAIVEAAASALGVSLNTTNEDENKWNGRDRLEYGVGVGAGVMVLNRVAISARYYWDMGQLFTDTATSDDASSYTETASWAAGAMCNAVKTKQCSGISASLTLYF